MNLLQRQAQIRRDRAMTVRIGAFELRKKGVDRWDWRDPYHFLVGLSWSHFVAAFVGAELALNTLFASIYMFEPGSIANLPPGSFLLAFSFSLETLATVGYGVMAPQSVYGHIVSAIEIVLGVLFTAIVTGLIFVRFARPRAIVSAANNLVIARHDGAPTLMARIGNGRLKPLVDARARMSAIVAIETSEGKLFRTPVDLPLLRMRIANFALTWTLMHRIDENSPLYGLTGETVVAKVTRIYATVEARDPVVAAGIHTVLDWGADQVLFGTRYADAVSIDDKGRTVVDMRLISDVEPDEFAEQPSLDFEEAAEMPENPVMKYRAQTQVERVADNDETPN